MCGGRWRGAVVPTALLRRARAGPGAALLRCPRGPGPGASRSSPRAGGSRRCGRGAGTARAGARALRLPRLASGALWPGPPLGRAPLGLRRERGGPRKLRASALERGGPAHRTRRGAFAAGTLGQGRPPPPAERSPQPGRLLPKDAGGLYPHPFPAFATSAALRLPPSVPPRHLSLSLSIGLSLLRISISCFSLLRIFIPRFSFYFCLLPLCLLAFSFFFSVFSFSFPSVPLPASPSSSCSGGEKRAAGNQACAPGFGRIPGSETAHSAAFCTRASAHAHNPPCCAWNLLAVPLPALSSWCMLWKGLPFTVGSVPKLRRERHLLEGRSQGFQGNTCCGGCIGSVWCCASDRVRFPERETWDLVGRSSECF